MGAVDTQPAVTVDAACSLGTSIVLFIVYGPFSWQALFKLLWRLRAVVRVGAGTTLERCEERTDAGVWALIEA